MKNAPDEHVEFEDAGAYVGQCRTVFNILEQWDGARWRRVPSVIDRRPAEAQPLHFFPEEDADRWFWPR